jgi:hypothetical protein
LLHFEVKSQQGNESFEILDRGEKEHKCMAPCLEEQQKADSAFSHNSLA